MYLGRNKSENGRVEADVHLRIQTGANARRKIEEVMMDRNITITLKGKVMDSCIVPASMYGLEMEPKTQEKELELRLA